MKVLSLSSLNLLLGISLGLFIFNMLPYADAINCGALERGSKQCTPIGLIALVSYCLLPIVIATLHIALARKYEGSFPKLKLYLLCFWPAMVVLWVVVVVLKNVVR
jgi:hypothetical protein